MIKVAPQKIQEEQKTARRTRPAHNKSTRLEKEFGGPKGREPTRYGDWEKNGRCIDF